MKKQLQLIILLSGTMLMTACGGGGGSSDSNTQAAAPAPAPVAENTQAPVIDTKTRALQIIMEYARTNGTSAVPVARTYAYAGVVGIGNDNVAELNEIVANLTPEEVNTTEKLQALLDAMGESSDPIAPIPPSVYNPDYEFPGLPTGPEIPEIPDLTPEESLVVAPDPTAIPEGTIWQPVQSTVTYIGD